MRALIQRVTRAAVEVDGREIGRIGPGLLVLVCAMQGDDEAAAAKLAARVAKLRIFKDDADKMNRSVLDIAGEALVVSQFTLAADTRSGTRPSFSPAASPDDGRRLFDHFVRQACTRHGKVETGKFGADMKVSLTNDGPVTIWLRVDPVDVKR